MATRVLMAMSGGVDSTAAALLLQEQGYDLVGCTFRTRYTRDEDVQAARQLAASLHIKHVVLDADQRFEEEVVKYFCHEYLSGRTPNPCVLCNRQIKFGWLMEEADRFGCDKIATGHYARLQSTEQGLFLARAKDERKDQTYFLWQVAPDTWSRVLFPLGDYTKDEIRHYLSAHGLEQLSRSGESQDICFIRNDYREFLLAHAQQEQVGQAFSAGDYVDAAGNRLGQHQGFASYTIGQRKGLGIALGEPAFVTKIDAQHNQITLGKHADLYAKEVTLRDVMWRGDSEVKVLAQIRYRSQPSEAVFQPSTQQVVFTAPVWGVTPGQSVVMYQNGLLVGGGIIQ